MVSTVETINLSAAGVGNLVNVNLNCSFLTPEIAAGIKSMLDTELLPQIQMMAPAMANGAEVDFVKTLATAVDGKVAGLSFSLNQKDILAIMQAVSTMMNAAEAEGDDDDDIDGVEVEEVEEIEIDEL